MGSESNIDNPYYVPEIMLLRKALLYIIYYLYLSVEYILLMNKKKRAIIAQYTCPYNNYCSGFEMNIDATYATAADCNSDA